MMVGEIVSTCAARIDDSAVSAARAFRASPVFRWKENVDAGHELMVGERRWNFPRRPLRFDWNFAPVPGAGS
jgi:hypothetical protein